MNDIYSLSMYTDLFATAGFAVVFAIAFFCDFERLWFFGIGFGYKFSTLPSPSTCTCQAHIVIGKYQNYNTSVSLTWLCLIGLMTLN